MEGVLCPQGQAFKNQLTPLAKGVLIFDEVKVQSGVSVYVCVCVCVCVCVHVWVCACVGACAYMCVHRYNMYVCACMHACVPI